MGDVQDVLRKLAIRDDAYFDFLLARDADDPTASGLEPKVHLLVGIAALVAIDAPTAVYLRSVDLAREYGASDDEIVGTLIASLPAAGVARVVSAAPKLGLALGYDVLASLEDWSSH